MAAFLPHLVTCACGTTFVVDAAESINVRRLPKAREDILASELHRATCPGCNTPSTVEKDFFYADPERHFFCKVQPRGERHRWATDASDLDAATASMPQAMSPMRLRTLRVVFGMDELREKLIAQDAGLDDQTVELLKVFLTHEHPILLNRPRLRLRLDARSPEELVFVAAYEHDPHRFTLRVPMDQARAIARRSGEMAQWLAAADPADRSFAPGAQWVNMWKWSPQTAALRDLETLNHDIESGKVALESSRVTWILERIPRGSHLPEWAKQELAKLFKASQKANVEKLQRAIFNVRFQADLASDWTTNRDRKDIGTLWRLFQTLPPNNVEGNTKIREIEYGRGSVSTYDATSRDIFISSGNARNHKDFVSTVRHEVGHAVHERIKPRVDAWLETRFRWRTFDATKDTDIDAWIELMGGWQGISSADRRDVRRQLMHAVGAHPQSWTAGKLAPVAPRSHPWNGAKFGPRLALEGSGDAVHSLYWYDCYKTWYGRGRWRFACNFWYGQLMAVSVDTLEIVTRMKSPYAAMSPSEFFAEMYAVYYDTNPKSRAIFPLDIRAWFAEFVEERGNASVAPPHTTPRQPRGFGRALRTA